MKILCGGMSRCGAGSVSLFKHQDERGQIKGHPRAGNDNDSRRRSEEEHVGRNVKGGLCSCPRRVSRSKSWSAV